MNGTDQRDAMRCTLEVLPVARIVEFVAFGAAHGTLAGDWPRAAGAALRGADGWPVILHFAPARWLLPQPDVTMIDRIEAAVAAGAGAAIEVEGKWVTLSLCGADAARLLSSSLDVAAVLAGRDCAAVELFDCPAVLASAAPDYRIYIKSSFAADFTVAVERLLRAGGAAIG